MNIRAIKEKSKRFTQNKNQEKDNPRCFYNVHKLWRLTWKRIKLRLQHFKDSPREVEKICRKNWGQCTWRVKESYLTIYNYTQAYTIFVLGLERPRSEIISLYNKR